MDRLDRRAVIQPGACVPKLTLLSSSRQLSETVVVEDLERENVQGRKEGDVRVLAQRMKA